MENFEWRYEQRQWDWDNPFLPVKAHLRLSVWGGCPGCNCGDPASGGLVLSFQADQIIPSWTAWGPEVTFPIGRKALQGGTKPLVSQESMSLNITSFYCGGKISVVSVPQHSLLERKRLVFQVLLPLPLKHGWFERAWGFSWLWLQSIDECLMYSSKAYMSYFIVIK